MLRVFTLTALVLCGLFLNLSPSTSFAQTLRLEEENEMPDDRQAPRKPRSRRPKNNHDTVVTDPVGEDDDRRGPGGSFDGIDEVVLFGPQRNERAWVVASHHWKSLSPVSKHSVTRLALQRFAVRDTVIGAADAALRNIERTISQVDRAFSSPLEAMKPTGILSQRIFQSALAREIRASIRFH